MTEKYYPYFASDCGDRGFQLQKDDESDQYDTDEEAVHACVEAALKGDLYSLQQLIIAAGDPLVRQATGLSTKP